MKKLVIFVAALATSLQATTFDGSSGDLQSKLTSAASGDVLQAPHNGSFTWSTTVSWSAKGVTIDFNGSTITRGTATGILLSGSPDSSHSIRITNGTFVETTTDEFIKIDGTSSTFAYPTPRIDHCNFSTTSSSPATFLEIYYVWPLIDHCTFEGDSASEMIHNKGWVHDDTTGWSETITPGSKAATYVEDCTFTRTTQSGMFQGCSAIQNYDGSRIVFRYNTCNFVQIDAHGTGGDVGCRWWELYGNNFVIPSSGSPNQSEVMDLRAGSGVCWNNITTGGTNGGAGNCKLREEDAIISAASRTSGTVTLTLAKAQPTMQTADSVNVTGFSGGSLSPNGVFLITVDSSTQVHYSQAGSDVPSFTTDNSTVVQDYWFPFQVGRGKSSNVSAPYYTNQVLDPAYFWSNTFKNGPGSSTPYLIQDGRDFYSNTEKSGYVPFQYPYLGAYPTSVSINTAGTQMTVNWNISCTNGSGGGDGMTLSASGGAVSASYSSGSGSAAFVYALNRTIQLGEAITLSYAQPGTGIQTTSGAGNTVIQDVTDIGSWPQTTIPAFSVANNSTQSGGAGYGAVGGKAVVGGKTNAN